MQYRKQDHRFTRHIISIPFIYAMLVPLVLLDITIEIYHRVCFQLYGLQRINRSEYIKIDRHKLKYLSWYEKINCAYCGYANGLLPYCAKIAAETEKYWCGIKHNKQKQENFREPSHHKSFVKYGDEKAFFKKYGK